MNDERGLAGRPGFDVTFSCRVSGSPAPQIWWSLQDRQLLNVTTADSLTEHLLLSQDAVATPNVHDGDLVVAWSNLTLRRIGEQDAGQYRYLTRTFRLFSLQLQIRARKLPEQNSVVKNTGPNSVVSTEKKGYFGFASLYISSYVRCSRLIVDTVCRSYWTPSPFFASTISAVRVGL